MNELKYYYSKYMPNIQIEPYRTRDLGEAGALLMQKQELLSVERDGSTCWFIFKDKNSCRCV